MHAEVSIKWLAASKAVDALIVPDAPRCRFAARRSQPFEGNALHGSWPHRHLAAALPRLGDCGYRVMEGAA